MRNGNENENENAQTFKRTKMKTILPVWISGYPCLLKKKNENNWRSWNVISPKIYYLYFGIKTKSFLLNILQIKVNVSWNNIMRLINSIKKYSSPMKSSKNKLNNKIK